MPTGPELKKNALNRLKVGEGLIRSGDYTLAVEMLVFALEIALKACICKTLNLEEYPDNIGNKQMAATFRTHKFDELLLFSGFQNKFELRSGNKWRYNSWSQATGKWDVSERYVNISKYTKADAELVLKALTRANWGVITWIKENRKW